MNIPNFQAVFNPTNKLNKNGEALIYLQYSLERLPLRLNTGIRIKPIHWSKNKRRVIKRNDKDAINSNLIKLTNELTEYCYKCKNENKSILHQDLKAVLNPKEQKSSSFIKYFENEIESNESRKPQTKKVYRITLNHLKSFRTAVNFNDLDYRFIKDLDNHLKVKGLGQRTINKVHSRIQTIILSAEKEDLIGENPYKKFKKGKAKEVIKNPFTPKELEQLERHCFDNSNAVYEKYRDMFLFMCYTGLSFTDMQKAKHTDIEVEEESNIYWLKVERQKTGTKGSIPISEVFGGKPFDIVEKYKRHDHVNLFPSVSNGKFNKQIKFAVWDAGIDKYVSAKVARDTFATNAVNLYGASSAMYMLCHKDLKITNQYTRPNEQHILQAIQEHKKKQKGNE